MKILIAVDGSEHSMAAVNGAAGVIVNPAQTTVRIVSVVDLPGPMGAEPFAISADYYREIESSERARSEELAEKAKLILEERFASSGMKIETVVLKGSAGRIIVEESEEWNADMIVVGSHGYGFWNRVLLGSVSQSVVQNAPCSVLVVRSRS